MMVQDKELTILYATDWLIVRVGDITTRQSTLCAGAVLTLTQLLQYLFHLHHYKRPGEGHSYITSFPQETEIPCCTVGHLTKHCVVLVS